MQSNGSGPKMPSTLAVKLQEIKNALATLTAEEREFLVTNPKAVEDTFGAVRPTNLKKVKSLLDRYLATERPFPPHGYSNVVKLTKAQQEEVRRLQSQVLEKQGVDTEKQGLAKVRGKRTDPFPDADPEPTSDEEE
ncbi:hypothetical protein NKH36_25550 [Mesorhizobium sp. M1312]|uniref:hypothetical protein n=1 Tax=unclassified Mesorhizobium TaxID=325217 RepID=UPI00333CFC5A